MYGKKIINIIPNVKSKDKENRKKIPKGLKIPHIINYSNKNNYINFGIKKVNKHFKNNYGTTETSFIFPIDHKTAKKWLNYFIKNKFNNFGKYQDSIDKDNNFLFHSLLSTSINIGLLNPSDIIEEIMKYEKKIPINSLEGFIRQLFWREYQRYCYIYIKNDLQNKNYFGNKKKLEKKWYDGTTGIIPVDNCIKNGFDTVRYLHAHVMDHYGNGTKKGAKSVDHINQQMDDNRNENLRLLSQSEQNKNTGKRARKKNAQPLPEELNGIELPKFVNYNCEKRTTKHGVSYRDFFRIEKHPKLKKVWSSSKSIKIDIIEKLEQTKKRLAELENE